MRHISAAVLALVAVRLPAPDVCTIDRMPAPLSAVPEASGVAVSRRSPQRLWVHNDSGQPVLFAVDANGAVEHPVRVRGAEIRDWEDIASSLCSDGPCLYIADIGDNDARRSDITIYRVSEPGDRDAATAPVHPIHARYPDGPHDAEAFFVTRAGDMFLVTKERPPVLYRLAASPAAETAAGTLERVKVLQEFGGKVTGAGISRDDRWVALRTHSALFMFRRDELTSPRASEPLRVDVSALGEPQGEGVAFGDDGFVYLAGEGGGHHRPGTLARLRCTLN